jgi:hypothetical protein
MTNFSRKTRGPWKPPRHRRQNGKDSGLYPFIVGGFALVAVYSVVNPDKMPRPVQAAVSASRNLMRENSPLPGAYYPNCAAARAAGVAPIYAGEPGYREPLDRDGDGVACEPYRGR